MRAKGVTPASALLAFAVSACGAASTALVASGEYDAYRDVRAAATREEQLAACWQYLQRYPDGHFAEQVRGIFEGAEVEYWRYSENSAPALRRYLSTLPEGPGAERAQRRLAELELHARQMADREQQWDDHWRALDRGLAEAEDQRRTFLSEYARFVGHLSTVRSWGRRTHFLPHQFLFDWRLSEPVARCRGNFCVKALTLPYSIPETIDGVVALGQRVTLVDVVVVLRDGGVAAVELRGPQLFDRLAEAVELLAVYPGEPLRRAEAISVAVQVTAAALEAALPFAECNAQPIAPVVLERRCRGTSVQMLAGGELADDDVLRAGPPSEADRIKPEE